MLKGSGKKLLWIAAPCKRSPQKEQWRVSKAQIMMSPSSLDQSWSSGNFRPWGSLKPYLRNRKQKTGLFPELAVPWSSPTAIQRLPSCITSVTSCNLPAVLKTLSGRGQPHLGLPPTSVDLGGPSVPADLWRRVCLWLQPMESLGLAFTHRLTP